MNFLFVNLGAAVGSSLLATALASVPQSSSINRVNKKAAKMERLKKDHTKHSKQNHASGNQFDSGINHLSTSTPLPKQKASKFHVPLPTPHEGSSMARTTNTLAVDKLLRQIVGSRVQPFKCVIAIFLNCTYFNISKKWKL